MEEASMKKLILAGVLCLFPLASMAASITYLLHDVVFDDGGTASGSFDWPAPDGGASNISITTTAGQSRSYDVTYTDQWTPSVLGVYFALSLIGPGGVTTDHWAISFDSTGPFAGAFYLSTPKPYFYNAYAEADASGTYLRNIVSGYASPVPIPAASWLFGTSLVGLFFRKSLVSSC